MKRAAFYHDAAPLLDKMIKAEIIKKELGDFGITEFAVIPAEKAALLDGKTLPCGLKNCVIFLIPYNTGKEIRDNYIMGRFARSLDYHAFAKEVCERLTERLRLFAGKDDVFVSFCDSSPTDEKQTAINAGLGTKGRNSLLINGKYGSYCFISEIYTSADAEPFSPEEKGQACSDCFACMKACPAGAIGEEGFIKEKCLSFISQKKKKTDAELALLKSHNAVWGCDICQQACPVNKKAQLSVIEYFSRDFISDLTPGTISGMTDEEYEKRSFSYRKRGSVEENF